MEIISNKDLSQLNSFKIKVVAENFIELNNEADFIDLQANWRNIIKPIYILGGGNNTLFISNFQGTVIKISNKGISSIDNNADVLVSVKAGEDWNNLINFSLSKSLFGLENLIDIPGQVGSTPIQNIGAYGVEVQEYIEEVIALDIENGSFKTFSNSDCKISYRSSIFKTDLRDKFIIYEVVFKLKKHGKLKLDYGSITEKLKSKGIAKPNQLELSQCISEIRASKLPDPKIIGNAGSFFKNPLVNEEKYFHLKNIFPQMMSYKLNENCYKIAAGWLIENAGWKGKEMGSAAVHKDQALVIINKNGEASGEDIMHIANEIIISIKDIYDIFLEPEVNIIGN